MVIHIYGCCLHFRRDLPSFDGLSETGGSIISEASHHGSGQRCACIATPVDIVLAWRQLFQTIPYSCS